MLYWQPLTAAQWEQNCKTTKSDFYKPLNIYVFGQPLVLYFYLNNMCVWDVSVRFAGSLITFHWSCLPDASRLGSISHNQDKMLNTLGNKWGLARNGIGKMPTSCWKLKAFPGEYFVCAYIYKWKLVFPCVIETLKISFTIALYCLNIFCWPTV